MISQYEMTQKIERLSKVGLWFFDSILLVLFAIAKLKVTKVSYCPYSLATDCDQWLVSLTTSILVDGSYMDF